MPFEESQSPGKMPEIETLGILDEIQALVSDHLQAVTSILLLVLFIWLFISNLM